MINPNLPMRQSKTKTLVQVAESDTQVNIRARVILFNDDFHTFEEVIDQVMLAIRCSTQRAEDIAWNVHNNGQATVHAGALEDCLEVSAVLEEIDLRTEVQL